MTDDIKELSMADLVSKVVEMQQGKEDLEAGISVIKDELRDRLVKLKITGTKVGDYFISRVKRLNTTDVSLSDARELGATNTKEVINGELLKKLFAKGMPIKGAKFIEFVVIKQS